MEISQAKIEANRANAQKSAGPRSAPGKARSAQNAVTHGLLSRQIPLIAGEDADDWRDLRERLIATLRPIDALEEALVELIVGLVWRLRRVPALEAAFLYSEEGEAREHDQNHVDELMPDDPEALRLRKRCRRAGNRYYLGRAIGNGVQGVTNLGRYEGGLQRRLHKLLDELDRLQAQRPSAGSERRRVTHPVIDVNSEEAPAHPHRDARSARITRCTTRTHRRVAPPPLIDRRRLHELEAEPLSRVRGPEDKVPNEATGAARQRVIAAARITSHAITVPALLHAVKGRAAHDDAARLRGLIDYVSQVIVGDGA